MAMYAFYCCKKDGVSTALISCELESDDVALVRAMALLEEHQSAAYVAVFDGERPVLTRHRLHEGLRALLSRPSRPSKPDA